MINNKDGITESQKTAIDKLDKPVKRKSKRTKSRAFLTSIQPDPHTPQDFENVIYVDFKTRKRLSA